jgi:hypothetical protein
MSGSDQKHWDRVYGNKGEFQVSWFQDDPALSLELIRGAAPSLESAIIDIGGGAARLVDALLAHDYRDVSVLDLSEAAIGISRARLGAPAERVTWIAADVMRWRPERAPAGPPHPVGEHAAVPVQRCSSGRPNPETHVSYAASACSMSAMMSSASSMPIESRTTSGPAPA